MGTHTAAIIKKNGTEESVWGKPPNTQGQVQQCTELSSLMHTSDVPFTDIAEVSQAIEVFSTSFVLYQEIRRRRYHSAAMMK